MLKIGDIAECSITGYRGKIVSKIDYLFSASQFCVQAEANADNKVPEPIWGAIDSFTPVGVKALNLPVNKVKETDEADVEEEEDFAPKKKSKAKVEASFDSDDAEEEEASKAKKTKVKKITIDDVNDAAKAYAASIGGKPGREAVLKILKKNFKTESISSLEPEQFQLAIDLLEVE